VLQQHAVVAVRPRQQAHVACRRTMHIQWVLSYIMKIRPMQKAKYSVDMHTTGSEAQSSTGRSTEAQVDVAKCVTNHLCAYTALDVTWLSCAPVGKVTVFACSLSASSNCIAGGMRWSRVDTWRQQQQQQQQQCCISANANLPSTHDDGWL
jgi:hypothetical protein